MCCLQFPQHGYTCIYFRLRQVFIKHESTVFYAPTTFVALPKMAENIDKYGVVKTPYKTFFFTKVDYRLQKYQTLRSFVLLHRAPQDYFFKIFFLNIFLEMCLGLVRVDKTKIIYIVYCSSTLSLQEHLTPCSIHKKHCIQ